MRMNDKLIAPSILSADFSKLGSEISDVDTAGSDWIHVDVMDGHFVPNLTIGPPVIQSIRKITKLPLDVHLMIEEPIRFVKDYRVAGADILTVHVEACKNVAQTLKEIKSLGAQVGISLRPKTNVTELDPYLSLVDFVLVMTVEPGFGGQAFLPDMLKKVTNLKSRFKGLISVDGGINLETAKKAALAGASIFVAGSAIFKEPNRKAYIDQLRQAIS